MASYHCEKCGRVFDAEKAHGVCPACATPVAAKNAPLPTVTAPDEQERLWIKAVELKDNAASFGDFEKAEKLFLRLGDFQKAREYAAVCHEAAENIRRDAIYTQAKNRQGSDITSWQGKAELMRSIAGFRDADALAVIYQQEADALMKVAEETRLLKEKAHHEEKRTQQATHQKRRRWLWLGVLTAAAILVIVLAVSLFIWPAVQYRRAKTLYDAGNYAGAVSEFHEIAGYSDSTAYLQRSYAFLGQAALQQGDYLNAVDYLALAGEQENAAVYLAMAQEALYEQAMEKLQNGQFSAAQEAFDAVGDYEDAKEYKHFCRALRVWSGDESQAEKRDLTKAENVIWKTLDGVWYSDENGLEITVQADTRQSSNPDITIEKDTLQYTVAGETYTVQILSPSSVRLLGGGTYAGLYEKA